MSEIKVGDLVMVVKPYPCCGKRKGLGYIFRVEDIEPARWFRCRTCGSDMSDGRLLAYSTAFGKGGYIELDCLKRIDPLPESETIEHSDRQPIKRVR